VRIATPNMGNYPSIGSRGGTVIGALELNLCGGGPCAMCKCCGKWNNCCADTFCPCCPGVTSPKGPEWEAAKEGFAPFMEEAATVAYEKAIRCGCCNDVMMAKQLLDADWTSRANAYLAQHGLSVEVCAFYTSDGKNTTPHLVMQFSKTA